MVAIIFLDKHTELKARPKLSDAVFNKEVYDAEITFLKYVWTIFLLINCVFVPIEVISENKCEKQSKKW